MAGTRQIPGKKSMESGIISQVLVIWTIQSIVTVAGLMQTVPGTNLIQEDAGAVMQQAGGTQITPDGIQ